jgi:hypothetical protein
VSAKIVAAIHFPLPPLAEQHRMVAKVDDLMALVRSAGGGARRARGDARSVHGGKPRPPQRARSRNISGRCRFLPHLVKNCGRTLDQDFALGKTAGRLATG